MLLLAGALSFSSPISSGVVGQEESVVGGQQGDVVDITSIELIRGFSENQFTLLVRCDTRRESNWFWVRNTTFVLDIRRAYMPFRGQALGQLLLSQVSAVRASQFMAGVIPVARVEIDVTSEKGVEVRWTSEGIEVMFGPPGPAIPAPTRIGTTEPGPVQATPATPPPDQPVAAIPESLATAEAAGQALQYQAGTRVNPFDPLLKPPDETVDLTNTLTRPLPDAEQLTLNGVTWRENRPDDSIALLRDGDGRNYRLKKGDRVKYGFVSHIGEGEIIFVLDIYGRHKVVTLKINP